MTAVRTAFDRGANVLIRAGTDLRAAGDRLTALTADLDEPLLLGADGFADLVDPDAADDRLAAALARLAAGGTGADWPDRIARGQAPDLPARDSLSAEPPARQATGARGPSGLSPAPGVHRDGEASAIGRDGLRQTQGDGPHPDRSRSRPTRDRPDHPDRPADALARPSAGPDRLQADPTATPRRAMAGGGGPAAVGGAGPTGAPPRHAPPTTGPLRLADGLPPAVRRALVSGDRRALDAAVARAATAEPASDHAVGSLSGALARIERALDRIGPHARRPAAGDRPSTAPRAAPAAAPTPGPILLASAPSSLRRLAERAGAIAAVPSPAADHTAGGAPGAGAEPAGASTPGPAAPSLDLAGAASLPRHDTAAARLDDDARLAERLADLLRREARAQGIGGRR